MTPILTASVNAHQPLRVENSERLTLGEQQTIQWLESQKVWGRREFQAFAWLISRHPELAQWEVAA